MRTKNGGQGGRSCKVESSHVIIDLFGVVPRCPPVRVRSLIVFIGRCVRKAVLLSVVVVGLRRVRHWMDLGCDTEHFYSYVRCSTLLLLFYRITAIIYGGIHSPANFLKMTLH